MKVYFLEITPDDLSASLENPGKWVTDPIDLYQNDSYTNYSVVKSSYGFGPERATWIGTQKSDSEELLTWDEITNLDTNFTTDSGEVLDGRFVDKTGRIDIISYNVSEESSDATLSVYHSSDTQDDYYPEEWDYKGPINTNQEIALIDSSQYAKFEFEFDAEEGSGPSPLFLAYVRIEIDRTVMAPLYRSSRQLLDQFPEWMALSDVPEEQDIPVMEKPTSLGGNFLNAIAGEWLDDIKRVLSYRDFQKYIDTVDLDQMAWAWRCSQLPRFITSITGDGIELARTAGQEEFRDAADDDACFIDFNDDTLYTTKKYDELLINDEPYIQELHQMWNYLDEIGLFVDLPRLRGEDNAEYQLRILDVYKNRGGVGVEQLKLALRRELNLWKHFGVEIDSDYDGATPEILDIEDLERMNDPDDPKRYFEPDGMPTPRFVEFAEKLSQQYPTTWGRFRWGKAIWDLGGKDHSGYNIVPYRLDAERLDDRHIQSGVGDGNDLFVFRPDVVTGPREFNANLKVRGKERSLRTEYPAVEFDLSLKGVGMRDVYDHPEKTVALTLEVVVDEVTWVSSFEMTSRSDADVEDFEDPDGPVASEATYDIMEVISEDNTTDPELEFRHKTTGELYEGTGIIPIEDVTFISLVQGTWQDGAYVDLENSDDFEAWFSYNPSWVLTYDSDSVDFYTSWSDMSIVVVMRSKLHADPVPTEWHTDEHLFKIKLNGVPPKLEPVPVELDIPQQYLLWDPYVTDRSIQLEITTINPDATLEDEDTSSLEYGGISRDEHGDSIFVPIETILIDGVSDWDGNQKLIPDDTELITISTAEDENYPIVFPVWDMFEAETQSSISGIVDENGPWRNGMPSSPGNTDFLLTVMENLGRDDFGIPNTDDYIINWMGIEADNSRVIVWMENNTVKPADYDPEINYPEKAIEEFYHEPEDAYFYTPFRLYARIKPGPEPEWYPQIHSGYFYDRNDEYYFYANKVVEETFDDTVILDQVVRQGAPVIVQDSSSGETLRQVAFTDVDTFELTLENTQTLQGNGNSVLYLAYADVYGVTVENAEGEEITLDQESETSEIRTSEVTDHDSEYTVKYRVRNSFFVDNDHIVGRELRTRIVFDSPPDDKYIITYEGSALDPATTVDLPLNPLFSMRNEGFIFISHNEYTLDSIRVRLSSPRILADGVDYIMVTIDSMDRHGNPKPEQDFTLSTTFGTLEETEITTDHDGFAVLMLHSDNEMDNPPEHPTEEGTLSISGGVNADVDFSVEQASPPEPVLNAAPKAEKIQADGVSQNLVYGKIEMPDLTPPDEGTLVKWRKARSLYELFESDLDTTILELNEDDSASFNPGTAINQNIEIIVDIHPYSWSGDPQTIISQYDPANNNRSWQLNIDESGGLYWRWSFNGTSSQAGDIVPSMPPGNNLVKVTRDASTGQVKAFLQDEYGDWNTEEEGVLDGPSGALHSSSASIRLGANSQHQFGGRIRTVELRHNGTLITSEDFGSAPWQDGDTGITRNGWTLNGNATVSRKFSGETTTDNQGIFSVGPFPAFTTKESGYWFMSLEATVDGIDIGDVVFWYEYPVATMGVENADGIPQQPVQMKIAVGTLPPYAYTVRYPVSYDERSEDPPEQTVDIKWLPPTWFAISAWRQYQLGIDSHEVHKLM